MSLAACELSRVLELIERRAEDRSRLAMVVDVVPLDESLRNCGESRPGVTRDLSNHGIGLLAELPGEARFLRVTLPVAGRDDLLVEIIRSEPLGCLCEIGGRIVDADDSANSQKWAGMPVPLQPDRPL